MGYDFSKDRSEFDFSDKELQQKIEKLKEKQTTILNVWRAMDDVIDVLINAQNECHFGNNRIDKAIEDIHIGYETDTGLEIDAVLNRVEISSDNAFWNITQGIERTKAYRAKVKAAYILVSNELEKLV